MSIFNPENREDRESLFEAKKFSPEFEKRLLTALEKKRESFPDVILCPNGSCGCPMKVQFLENAVRVWCVQCGWEQILRSAQVHK
ncbi:hypothetical protein HQ487_02740 [Candidatus Uhrbacteria bacterium]|nr:hypothetical protein [Candidatus Uhrbacteria bacterium]